MISSSLCICIVAAWVAISLVATASMAKPMTVNAVQRVTVADAKWMRLFFAELDLPAGVALRMTSGADGATQHLCRVSAEQWQHSSAYFNGDTVWMEVIAREDAASQVAQVGVDFVQTSLDMPANKMGPWRPSAFAVEEEESLPGVTSICYNPDTRVLSNDTRSGRYMYGGATYDGCCTAWLIDDANHCFLSAGHCTDEGNSVVQFNVPMSDEDGNLQHPPPEDQYAVDQESMQANTLVDWRYFGVFPNSETGLHPVEAYRDGYYTIQRSGPLPEEDTPIEIIGYGENESKPDEYRRIQQHATGPYHSSGGDAIRYRVDTSNGNSGSAVLDLSTGLAIGIHTLGGCSPSSQNSFNAGTSIFATSLQSALERPTGVCAARHT